MMTKATAVASRVASSNRVIGAQRTQHYATYTSQNSLCERASVLGMKFLLLSFAFIGLMVGTARADWDRNGWVKLGEQTVNGKVDRDTIRVGTKEGKFTKLTIAVEKSELELLSFVVTFANGQKFTPAVKHSFKENSRTRVIDLPGDERVIQKIDITYKNVRGGGNAAIEVWGFKTDDNDRRDGKRDRR